MTDDEIKQLFIPDVYQETIYDIDYDKLWEAGIRLISFDVDDTIDDDLKNQVMLNVPIIEFSMPKEARELFKRLKEKGFKTAVISNSSNKLAKLACKDLKADWYKGEAHKPKPDSFKEAMEYFGMEPSQMAHVGNAMRNDVRGGNSAGITTCLVRRNGVAMKIAKRVNKALGIPARGELIREELKKRGISWRKHHKYEKGDQYYQLGEEPKYKQGQQWHTVYLSGTFGNE